MVVHSAEPSVSLGVTGSGVLERDARLAAMVQAIADGVRPSRIILFGSRARGDARPDSDYDLVVELDFEWNSEQHSSTHGRVVDALRPAREKASVDVLLRRPGDIERRRDDPGYMDWDIARDGIILYPDGADSEALRPRANGSTQVRERAPLDSLRDWVERIEQDLRIIEQNLVAGESAAWDAAGFHAQQAAEKYLKILLVQRGAHPPKTHEIDELIALVREAGYEFPLFAAESKALNDYAVAVRYPERLPIPDEAEGRSVIACAYRIIDAAKPFVVPR
jgi:HEPN domain-containing protein/predicted nucleotidyltransferase